MRLCPHQAHLLVGSWTSAGAGAGGRTRAGASAASVRRSRLCSRAPCMSVNARSFSAAALASASRRCFSCAAEGQARGRGEGSAARSYSCSDAATGPLCMLVDQILQDKQQAASGAAPIRPPVHPATTDTHHNGCDGYSQMCKNRERPSTVLPRSSPLRAAAAPGCRMRPAPPALAAAGSLLRCGSRAPRKSAAGPTLPRRRRQHRQAVVRRRAAA